MLKPWMKRVLSVVVLGAIFGTLGYFVSPKLARSAGTNGPDQATAQLTSSLHQANAKLQQVQSDLEKLSQAADAVQQEADDAALAAQAEKEKVAADEAAIAELNTRLVDATTAGEPLRYQLQQTTKSLDEARLNAAKAQTRADTLAKDLAATVKLRDELDCRRQLLEREQTDLTVSLQTQAEKSAALARLLDTLQLNTGASSNGASLNSTSPAEMPITQRELTFAWGNPAVSFTACGKTEMRWQNRHQAVVCNGLMTKLDRQPATRGGLAIEDAKAVTVVEPASSWRFAAGQSVSYVDLVNLYGRPEKTVGTGSNFTATWPVGAWGRSVNARVVDGVVAEFDGRTTDPATCCELVRQRANAYRNAGDLTQASTGWRAWYDLANAAVEKSLKNEAAQLDKDGLKLTRWTLADFDTVGTWVGQVQADKDMVMVRSVLDCTWTTSEGTSMNQRRYVVVSLPVRGGSTTDCVIFPPRD